MTGERGLRDELRIVQVDHQWVAASIWDGNCACGWTPTLDKGHGAHQLDHMLPAVQRHLDAAREQAAERIAQAIENNAARVQGSYADGLSRAGRIARQHAGKQP